MTRFLQLLVILLPALAAGCARAQPATGTFDRTVNVGDGVALDVRTGSGSITVRAGAAGKVEVHGEIRVGGLDRSAAEETVAKIVAAPPVELDGNTLRIGPHDEGSSWWHHVSISYEIVAPATVQLRSATGSGSQAVSGLAGPLELRSGSGSLSIDGVAGAVDARTGSGSITIAGRPRAPWNVETGSGAVRARIPADAAFSVDAQAGSGGVRTSHPVAFTGSAERHGIRGDVRGGGPLVRMRTGSGGISLE